jgi:membrane-associated phospholipid phosphatase
VALGPIRLNGEFLYGLDGLAAILLASLIRGVRKYDEILLGIGIVVCSLLVLPLCSWITSVRATTVDNSLRSFDLLLRLDGLGVGAFCAGHPIFWVLCVQAYNGLVLMFCLHWAIERSETFLRAAIIGAVLAVPFYLLVPACGPRYTLGGAPPPLQPRNCFPSMHMAWAILMILNARNPVWRTILIVYAFLMVFATIGSGEHYFVDLFAAVPFSLIVQQVAERVPSFGGFFDKCSGKRPADGDRSSAEQASDGTSTV